MSRAALESAIGGLSMNFWSFALLAVVVGGVLLRGLARPGGMLEYPFLAAATIAGWFMPQALLLMNDPYLPEGGYDVTMVMAALSMIAIVRGDGFAMRSSAAEIERYDEMRLLIGAAVLSAIGAVAFALLLRTPVEVNEEGLGTGIVTIYFFFFTAQFFGLALSLIVFLRRYSPLAAAIVAFDYISISSFILFGGRRGPLVEFALVTFCALWFRRRLAPPRALFIVGVVASALFVNAAGEYRSLVSSINANRSVEEGGRLPTFDEVMQIDFIGAFTSGDLGRAAEARNAIFDIAATVETMGFRMGADYWNYMVFRFIPAQLVGRDLKERLTVHLPDPAAEVYGHRALLGTTHTGFSDAFMSFGLAGALMFGLIAALLSGHWRRAMRGSLKSQYFYCILVTTGLHGITHGTTWFVAFVPQALGFSWIVFRWAEIKSGPHSRVVASQSFSRVAESRDLRASARFSGSPPAVDPENCAKARSL
jgi:hypothetical protein